MLQNQWNSSELTSIICFSFVFTLHSLCSALGQGIRRLGVTSFSYIPLSVINPVDAPGIIKRAEEDVKRRQEKGDLLPGLSEQLDIQLTMLRDDKLPDHQIVAYPGLFPGAGNEFSILMISSCS